MFNLYEIEFLNSNNALCAVRVFASNKDDVKLYFEHHVQDDYNKLLRIIPLKLENTVFKVINVKQYIM